MVGKNQTPSGESNIKRQTTDPKRRRFVVYTLISLVATFTIFAVLILEHFDSLLRDAISRFLTDFGSREIRIQIYDPGERPPGGQVLTCMQDVSCVDGEQVEVTLNGAKVFNLEIRNELMCIDDLPYKVGKNRLTLTAVKGREGEPNCDSIDGQFHVFSTLHRPPPQLLRMNAGESVSADVILVIRDQSE